MARIQEPATSGRKVARIQYELSGEKAERIEDLMRERGIRTKKDFLDTAVTLLEWAINERKQGKIIASVDEEQNRTKELVMPGVL